MHFGGLVDEIYEAAVVPERWTGVFDRLSHVADGEGALLFAAAAGPPRWLSSHAIRSPIEAWATSTFYRSNPRIAHLVPILEPRFFTDFDILSAEEIEREPFYTDFLRPRGLGWCVATPIHSPNGETLIFSIEKAYAKGPVPRTTVDQLDRLRPHLARAALWSASVGFDRSRATVEGLNLLGLPAAILGHAGKVIFANQELLGYAPDIRIGSGDRLELAGEQAQRLFVAACEMLPGKPVSRANSIAVAPSRGRPPFVAHLLPLRGRGRDIFTGAELLLFITPVVRQAGPPPEILQALFNLSPAEARVAALIAEGRAVNAVAEVLSVQPNTVRTHLKAIYSKTGMQRQADLINLLRMPSPPVPYSKPV